MTDVVEINRFEDLRSYHLAWTALHAQTPRATFFQTYEWLENYWRHCGEGQRLRVLIVRSSGRPIGILPLVEKTQSTRLGPVRVLTYPLDEWGALYGPIGPNVTATLAVAMKHLGESPATWDVFVPQWTPHETTDRGRTERAMRLAGMKPTVEAHDITSVIELDRFDGWESYLASRAGKVRQEVRRKLRRLRKNHRVEFVRHRPDPLRCGDGDPAWELYEQCLAIAAKSWQATSPDGNTLCDGSVAQLLSDAHEQAARLGMVDMSVLLIDGQPAAYYYGYHFDGEVVGLRTGYDPAFCDGAGAVLIGLMIEDSFARGDTRIDMGVGAQDYKRRLRTNTEKTSRLTHIAPTSWRSLALRAARQIAKRLRPAS